MVFTIDRGDKVDLEYLKKSARQFAYQLRKFFPEDEAPINHYVCENHVVVLSTKKMYIYYYDQFIDYVGDYYENVHVDYDGFNSSIVKITGRVFDLKFEQNKDSESFMKYYLKYKE